MPLRIGFFTDSYLPQVNGVAIAIQTLAGYLRSQGHFVHIFAPRSQGWRDMEGFVHRIPASRYLHNPPFDFAWPVTPAGLSTLTRFRFDIIHMHTPLAMGLAARLVARQRDIPLIYTYHTAISDYTHYVKGFSQAPGFPHLVRWFSAYTANWSDTIVIPSAKFAPVLRRQGVLPPIHLVPNGIDLEVFHRTSPADPIRSSMNMAPDDPLLLVVSRLAPEKRIDFLIEAFCSIQKEYPKARLVIAGDGSTRSGLEKQASATPCHTKIAFLGMVDRSRLPGLMHSADLFLSASTTEVHPLSVIEAIASGLPVVAVQDEALHGMVEEGINGHLVSREIASFSEVVTRLLTSTATRQSYAQASRRISERYSIESTGKALLALYIRAIQAKHLPKTRL